MRWGGCEKCGGQGEGWGGEGVRSVVDKVRGGVGRV